MHSHLPGLRAYPTLHSPVLFMPALAYSCISSPVYTCSCNMVRYQAADLISCMHNSQSHACQCTQPLIHAPAPHTSHLQNILPTHTHTLPLACMHVYNKNIKQHPSSNTTLGTFPNNNHQINHEQIHRSALLSMSGLQKR